MQRWIAVGLLLVGFGAMAEGPGDELGKAVNSFLGTLSESAREMATFDFNEEERWNWFFVPEPRLGYPMWFMTSEQEMAGLNVLNKALSASGMNMVRGIRDLESVLRVLENDDGQRRNSDKYYFSVFGTPGGEAPWGLRFEGHHLSLNWTIKGDQVIASSPQFFGTNPAEVPSGSMKGTRLLGAIEDEARKLVKSLSPAARKQAILSETAPRDILSGTERQAVLSGEKGIPYVALDESQQALILALIEGMTNKQHAEIAAERMRRVKEAGLDTITFTWMGGLEKGEGHYFAIRGENFLMEYDNTQNGANHVHLVWRQLGNDFGDDLLREHYAMYRNVASPGVHTH